jgi:FixJ family two-component response regulator
MPTITIIDDDPLVRIAIEMGLRKDGFSVRAFTSAAEFLGEDVFDDIACIVTDIEMPGGVTGLDLLAEMAHRAQECPVVVMTGKGEGAFRAAALALGARAYLEKPVTVRKLVDAIACALQPVAVMAA